MLKRNLALARNTVAHYRHQLPIAQHRVRLALKEVRQADHEVEVCELALLTARKFEGELVLKLLTCGISHRKALRILQQLQGA